MNSPRTIRAAAFTLIELLVVIAIIAIVAGLVVGLNNVAGEKKRVSRAQVERDRLMTLIENYKSKVGMYPPDNRQVPFNPALNSLFYELAGAQRHTEGPYSPANPAYSNIFGIIRGVELKNAFGIDGMINASEDVTDIKRILKDVKPDQTNEVVSGTVSFVIPIDGPGSNPRPNPWKYAVGTNAVHNPDSFDLWVDIIVRSKTNTIGNWKD